jgi:TonB-dependent receptor
LFPVYASDDLEAVEANNRYSNLLPSMNFRWDVTDEMVIRLAAAKTLTRPVLEQLAPAIFYRSAFAAFRSAYGNNPNLKPYTALNLDASWEYYYGREKGISVAGFYKNMDDYIVSTIVEEQIESIETPEFREYNVTRPRNAEKAKVKGVTLGWLHTFDFGLGLQANYTKVSGKVSSKSDPTQNFQLPGVSDTANLVGFFERGPIGLRVAWNWRDKFLAASTYGGYQHPRYFREYSQVDARLSVAAPMGIGLALDVVNLTNETVSSHGVNENAFISYGDYGRRFTLSASKRF